MAILNKLHSVHYFLGWYFAHDGPQVISAIWVVFIYIYRQSCLGGFVRLEAAFVLVHLFLKDTPVEPMYFAVMF